MDFGSQNPLAIAYDNNGQKELDQKSFTVTQWVKNVKKMQLIMCVHMSGYTLLHTSEPLCSNFFQKTLILAFQAKVVWLRCFTRLHFLHILVHCGTQ